MFACFMLLHCISLRAHCVSPPSAAISSAGVSDGRVQSQSTSNEPLLLKILNFIVSTEQVATRPFKWPLPAKRNLLLTSFYFSMGPTSNGGCVAVLDVQRRPEFHQIVANVEKISCQTGQQDNDYLSMSLSQAGYIHQGLFLGVARDILR